MGIFKVLARLWRGDAIGDLPAIGRMRPGDRFYAPGIVREARYNGAGVLGWEDAASSTTPSADNASDLGSQGFRWRDLWLARKIINAAGLQVQMDAAGETVLSLFNTVGTVASLLVTGTVRWRNSSLLAWTGELGGAFTADRVFDFPDASGTVPLLEEAQTWTQRQTFNAGAVVVNGMVADVTAIAGPVAGMLAFATNGRKPGQGVGAGTGVLAVYDGAAWVSCFDGAALAA